MSGIAKAVGKVFKSVGHFVQKYWKPIVAAVAIYFTAGMAAPALAGWLGGAAAAGEAGAAVGADALAAGAAGAADLGGAGVLTAEGAAAAGLGGEAAGAAGLGLTDWGAAAGADALAGGGAVAGAATGALGTAGDTGVSSLVSNPGAYTYAGPEMTGPPTAATVGAPSSLWDTSLGVAKNVLGTPGVPSLIGGLAQGLMAGNIQNAQMKWAEAHAPGQIAGGAGNAWGGFATNKNLTPTTPMPANSQLPPLTPYKLQPNQAQGPQMPGVNQPGSNSSNYPGYGTPGYGQQYPPGTAPPQPMPLAAMGQLPQDQYQQQGLLSQQTPFIESPYDESYV